MNDDHSHHSQTKNEKQNKKQETTSHHIHTTSKKNNKIVGRIWLVAEYWAVNSQKRTNHVSFELFNSYLPMCVLLLIVTRLWLVYFSFEYHLNSLELQWQSMISNNYKLPWTHRNVGNISGNLKNIIIFDAILLFLFVVSRELIYGLCQGKVFRSLYTIHRIGFASVILICSSVLFIKVQSSCRDVLGIHEEFKQLAFIVLVGTVWQSIIGLLFDANSEENIVLSFVGITVAVSIQTLISVSKYTPGMSSKKNQHSNKNTNKINVMMTKIATSISLNRLNGNKNSGNNKNSSDVNINNKNNKNNNNNNKNGNKINTLTFDLSGKNRNTNFAGSSASPPNSIKNWNQSRLMVVFTNLDAFKSFANHCVREFSVENILYLLEFLQLKSILYEKQLSFFVLYFSFCGWF